LAAVFKSAGCAVRSIERRRQNTERSAWSGSGQGHELLAEIHRIGRIIAGISHDDSLRKVEKSLADNKQKGKEGAKSST
jgi:hypothetical protein